jgi:hypothetical protein
MSTSKPNQFPEILEKNTSFYASVEFGQRLSNGNCGHLGICSATEAAIPGPSIAANKRHRCRSAIALVSLQPNGHVAFFFPKTGLRPCTIRAFLSDSHFLMPENFELPRHWQHYLPEMCEFTLYSGRYPIFKTELGFLICF